MYLFRMLQCKAILRLRLVVYEIYEHTNCIKNSESNLFQTDGQMVLLDNKYKQ